MASYLMPRPFPYNAARFRFAFRLHLLAIIGLALVAFLLLRLSPRLLLVAYILLIAMVVVIALTMLNALWPVRTTHSVDGESVILRQGLGFKLVIPLASVSKARRMESGAGRPGINLDRANGVLEVIAHGPEAVKLRLGEPVVYKGVLVREVVVDVLEPGEFIECIRERKKGAALLGKLGGGKGQKGPSEAETPILPEESGPPAEDADEDAGPDTDRERAPAKAERPDDLVQAKARQIEGPPAGPPPVKVAKAPEVPKTPATPRPPPEPKAPAGMPKAPPRSDDEDEIELVPALPSAGGAEARVVRIPKRKI